MFLLLVRNFLIFIEVSWIEVIQVLLSSTAFLSLIDLLFGADHSIVSSLLLWFILFIVAELTIQCINEID